jgi:hypothetical protein
MNLLAMILQPLRQMFTFNLYPGCFQSTRIAASNPKHKELIHHGYTFVARVPRHETDSSPFRKRRLGSKQMFSLAV